MMPYQNSTIDKDDNSAVPLGTTLLLPSPTTTWGHCAWMWMMSVVIVAGMMMLLLMMTGGTVWMMQDGGRTTTTTTAEDVLVGTDHFGDCTPAGGPFVGFSTFPDGEDTPFETCYQYNGDETYCWTKSWYSTFDKEYYPCVPDGGGKAWHAIASDYVNPGDPAPFVMENCVCVTRPTRTRRRIRTNYIRSLIKTCSCLVNHHIRTYITSFFNFSQVEESS